MLQFYFDFMDKYLDLGFTISNYSIDRVKEVVFLGVILDEHLPWKSHK